MTENQPGQMKDAWRLVFETALRTVPPRQPTTVSAWAEANMRLSSKQTAAPGRFRIDRNPALQEPMDCMSARSAVSEVVCCFPIQFGKSMPKPCCFRSETKSKTS